MPDLFSSVVSLSSSQPQHSKAEVLNHLQYPVKSCLTTQIHYLMLYYYWIMKDF